jgi:hypothetical protein
MPARIHDDQRATRSAVAGTPGESAGLAMRFVLPPWSSLLLNRL